jgi:hypothetical protein
VFRRNHLHAILGWKCSLFPVPRIGLVSPLGMYLCPCSCICTHTRNTRNTGNTDDNERVILFPLDQSDREHWEQFMPSSGIATPIHRHHVSGIAPSPLTAMPAPRGSYPPDSIAQVASQCTGLRHLTRTHSRAHRPM